MLAPQGTRRPGFSRRAQYGVFLGYVLGGLGIVIAAAMLLLSTFRPSAFAVVTGAMSELTTPVSSGFSWVRRGVSSVPSGIGSYFGVRSENARLKKQLADERMLVMRARTLNGENRRLRALLQVRDRSTEPVVAARLVGSTPSSTRRFATLNAGSRQGVHTGQPVRGPEGLIGQVIETSFNTARVMLIVDPESIVPVRRTRDGLPAIAVGRGDGLVDIRSAEAANVPFNAGDVFVTSGTGGIYPPNILVARVLKPSHDTALSRVYADPDSLDFALVLNAFMPAPEAPTPTPSATHTASASPAAAAR